MSPIMIPPIPDSKFIDKLPEEEQLEGQNAAEKELQDGYEAEVKVFRRFEDIERNIIVLHGLDYTHEQYCAFLPYHVCNNKRCNRAPAAVHECHQPKKNIDGEHDFIVFGRSFAAVFEVKGASLKDAEEDIWDHILRSCCDDGLKQRKRVIGLIRSVDSCLPVYQFTVFSNVSRDEVDEQFLRDEFLLFIEDLENLEHVVDWCEEFSQCEALRLINSKIVGQHIDEVERCLLGLWCVNTESKWDHTLCSLSRCILDIDSKLRRVVLTRKLVDKMAAELIKSFGRNKKKKVAQLMKKTYPHNPGMADAPELFQKYLNVESLTQGQLDVFNNNEQFLWVDGPAGSGKTIAMLGKILQLALHSEKRCLLLIVGNRNNPAAKRHLELFNEIRPNLSQIIVYEYRDLEGDFTLTLNKACNLLEAQLLDSRSKIVILVIRDTLLSKNISYLFTKFAHLFIDDYQRLVDRIHGDTYKEPSCAHILIDGLLPVVQSPASINNTRV